jgi:hypothetical protein
MNIYEGGCLCGDVRYRARGKAIHQSYCHCTICRRAAGAPVVSWLTLPVNGFEFTRGQPARYDSSDFAYREFCRRCGPQLTFRDRNEQDRIDITSASLDDPGLAPPKDHIWVRSRIGWFDTADALPRYDTERSPG